MSQDYEVKAGLAEVNSFTVVGISIMTDRSKATQDINALWEAFFSQQIGQKITAKTDDFIYAVYSDYEGDYEKPYRYTIGYRVEDDRDVETATDTQLNAVTIQDQSYAVMSATGKQPDALIETWTAIWASDLERTYKTDFELYGERFFEDGVNEVLIHVGVAT